MCELDYYWILICSKSLQCATLHWVRHEQSHIILKGLTLNMKVLSVFIASYSTILTLFFIVFNEIVEMDPLFFLVYIHFLFIGT